MRGIQLSREVRQANGSVDLFFSCTNSNHQVLKVCLEIKKAHHSDVESAISTQLPAYMASEQTDAGIYLVLWLKHQKFDLPKKYANIAVLQQALKKNNPDNSSIMVLILDCTKPLSPSTL